METFHCVGLCKWWSLDESNAAARFIERQQGGRERPGTLIILSGFPWRGQPPRVSSLGSCHTHGPGAATDAMPALTSRMSAFIPLRYPLSSGRAATACFLSARAASLRFFSRIVSHPWPRRRNRRRACAHEEDVCLHPAEISAILGTGGHHVLPTVDRAVGPGRNEFNGAGVQVALGHRSLKSIWCKRGRGAIVNHQMKRFISHLRNTEV